MNFETQIALLSILIMAGYATSALLILNAKIRNKKEKVKVKRKNKAYKNFSERLQQIVSEADEKMEKEDKVYRITGKTSGPIRNFRKSLIKVFSGKAMTSGVIRVFFFSVIVSVAIGIFSLSTMGPIIALSYTLCLLMATLSGITVYKTIKEISYYEEIANFMTINYSQYISSPTFEESIEKTLNALRPGTYSYAVTNKFLRGVVNYNIPLNKAIHDMKNEFLNVSHIVQYLDIVLKAETTDPDYKKSAGGIPENFSMDILQRKDFAMGMSLIFIISAVCVSAAVVYSLIASISNIEFITALNDPTGVKIITMGAVGLFLFQVIIFKNISRDVERVWDDD